MLENVKIKMLYLQYIAMSYIVGKKRVKIRFFNTNMANRNCINLIINKSLRTGDRTTIKITMCIASYPSADGPKMK